MATSQILNQSRTVPSAIEMVMRQANAGIDTIDTRYDDLFIRQMLIFGRAEMIKLSYTGSRAVAQNHYVPDICKQTYELQYDPLLNQYNDDCFNHFFCPDFISLDDESSGLRFVGNMKGNNNFMILRSMEQYAENLNDAIMAAIMDRHVLALYQADQRIIKLRDIAPDYRDIKSAKVRAIFANFLEIPDFNEDTDIIPLDGASVNTLTTAIWNAIRLTAYAKPDEVADGTDTSVQANLTRYLFNTFIKAGNPQTLGI